MSRGNVVRKLHESKIERRVRFADEEISSQGPEQPLGNAIQRKESSEPGTLVGSTVAGSKLSEMGRESLLEEKTEENRVAKPQATESGKRDNRSKKRKDKEEGARGKSSQYSL